jgi:hypothetical protein
MIDLFTWESVALIGLACTLVLGWTLGAHLENEWDAEND